MLHALAKATRRLLRAPTFTWTVVLVLTLGFALNAVVFGVVDAALFRPLPYREPARLVRVQETINGLPGSVSWANFDAWRSGVHSFSDVVAYDDAVVSVVGGRAPARTLAIVATPNLFRALGVGTLLGRAFAPGDGGPDQPLVAVLSESFWRSAFGGDSAVIGRIMRLNGVDCTIVGVASASFAFPAMSSEAMWIATQPSAKDLENRTDHHLSVIARLRDGATRQDAEVELRTVASRLVATYPTEQRARGARIIGIRDAVTGAARGQLLALLGAVTLVLLIACANVANLTLARAFTRRHEFAVRAALGAGRRHILREVGAESVVLVTVAAGLGGAAAWLARGVIRGLVQFAFPFQIDMRFDFRLFAFLCVGALLGAAITGAVPAILAGRRTDLRAALDAGSARSTGGRGHRARVGLVATQVALSLILVVGAGLLIRTVIKLGETTTGFDASNVMTAHVPTTEVLPGAGPVTSFFRPMLQRLRATPGVAAAGAISLLPLQEAWTNGGFRVEGQPASPAAGKPLAEYRIVSPGYFQALRIPILAGRDVAEYDDAADSVSGRRPPVVLVNAEFARRYLAPDGRLTSAIGRRLLDVGFSAPATVVGVVGDVRQADLQLPAQPEIYFPYAGMDDGHGSEKMVLVVHSSLGDQAASALLRQTVAAVDPTVPVSRVLPMNAVVVESVAKQRLFALLLGGIGITALLLTAAGVYAVLSYAVAERRREMGVRLALGAQGRDVLRLLLGESMRVTGAGLLAGTVGALLLTRSLRSAIYGVGAADPLTFLVAIGVIGAVALAASYIPARRAARVSPIVSLRAE